MIKMNMSKAFETYSNVESNTMYLEDIEIKEYLNRDNREKFVIIKIKDYDDNGNTEYIEISTTNLIMKQLENLPISWYSVYGLVIGKLKSKSTGRDYYMIMSVIDLEDKEYVLNKGNTNYVNIVEYFKEHAEDDKIEVKSYDIKEKEVIEDGASYNMYNIKIGTNTFLNLTRAMNKELTRLFRIHDKDKVKGLTFKIIDGIIKIVKIML